MIAAAGGRNCGAEGPLRETLSALGAQRTARGCTAQTVCPQHQTSGLCNLQPGFLLAAWLRTWLLADEASSQAASRSSQAAKAKAGHQTKTRQRRTLWPEP